MPHCAPHQFRCQVTSPDQMRVPSGHLGRTVEIFQEAATPALPTRCALEVLALGIRHVTRLHRITHHRITHGPALQALSIRLSLKPRLSHCRATSATDKKRLVGCISLQAVICNQGQWQNHAGYRNPNTWGTQDRSTTIQ